MTSTTTAATTQNAALQRTTTQIPPPLIDAASVASTQSNWEVGLGISMTMIAVRIDARVVYLRGSSVW